MACVGNSVTYGMTIENPQQNSYPAQLQVMLGDGFEVGNFGRSGATLLRNGHNPYNATQEYSDALDFAADKVVIHLGLNDTDPRNWPDYRDEFKSDYITLINSFREVNPDCEIWICRLTPISHRHWRFKSGTRDWHEQIQQEIETLAATQDVKLIDLHEILYSRPDLFADGLHPNREGAGIIAQRVYGAVTGDFGGLQMSEAYGDNMVLQREKELVIEGKANVGETIKVSVAGSKGRAKAGEDGRWSITLKPLKAGGPYTFKVESDTKSLSYNNVLVGEVWLCSGQSNMEFELYRAATAAQGAKEADGHKDDIRIFDMKENWRTDYVQWSTSALDSLNKLEHFKRAEWVECNSTTASDFSAIAYYFGAMLADSLQVPVGLICNAVGGSPAESWIDRRTLEFEFADILYDWKANDMIQEWVRGRGAYNTALATNPLQRHPYEPTYLYEAGIKPIADLNIGGVLWYQGESNAHNVELHEQLYPLLVESWRETFGDSNLPFYAVQLSSLNRPSWPIFRDSQRRLAESIEGCGMVVSSDRGNLTDVHPTDKKDIGERLALLALSQRFGFDVLPQGPSIVSAEAKGTKAVLTFDYGDGMQSSDGDAIASFEVADAAGVFYPATAKVEGGKVVVSSDHVKKPCEVRYGWQPYSKGNLVNSSGLPASTFKIDVVK